MGNGNGTGQPPSPPGENITAQQGQPPSGSGQPPTPPGFSSDAGSGASMTAIYEKMATELNVTADAIAKAMTQAQQEVQK